MCMPARASVPPASAARARAAPVDSRPRRSAAQREWISATRRSIVSAMPTAPAAPTFMADVARAMPSASRAARRSVAAALSTDFSLFIDAAICSAAAASSGWRGVGRMLAGEIRMAPWHQQSPFGQGVDPRAVSFGSCAAPVARARAGRATCSIALCEPATGDLGAARDCRCAREGDAGLASGAS